MKLNVNDNNKLQNLLKKAYKTKAIELERYIPLIIKKKKKKGWK